MSLRGLNKSDSQYGLRERERERERKKEKEKEREGGESNLSAQLNDDIYELEKQRIMKPENKKNVKKYTASWIEKNRRCIWLQKGHLK